jgi:uncharacterized membrane protein
MDRMDRTDLGRIAGFTDGVMAVAITLLVLNLEVPNVPAGELGEQLVDLIPSVLAYLLSFALVGRFWVIHHRLFETLHRFDGVLMALNLVFLAAIAIVPFSTSLYDKYTDEPLAVALFGLVMSLAAFSNWSMTAYTLRKGLVHDHHRKTREPFGSPVALGFTLIFLGSVPLAFVSVLAAQLLWLSTILLRYPLRRLTRQASSS